MRSQQIESGERAVSSDYRADGTGGEMRPDPPGCEAQGGPGLIRPLRRRAQMTNLTNAGGVPLVWFHQSGQVKKYPLNCGEPEIIDPRYGRSWRFVRAVECAALHSAIQSFGQFDGRD